MGKKKDYIPKQNLKFYAFIQNLVDLVIANAVAWGILPAKVTELTDARDVYVPLFQAISNPKNRTSAQVDAHKTGRKVFQKYIRAFVKENLINNSLIPHDKKIEMGLNPGSGTHSARPAITTAPVVDLRALGGFRVQAVCRVLSDDNRPSIQQDADGVEFRYLITTASPPANYKAATETFFSTKARFITAIDPADVGKTIYLFARWKNNSDDKKSGPWCDMVLVVIR